MPNVMLVHFGDLKKDMSGQMRKIAEFLEIPINEDKWDDIVEHCTFDYCKKNAAKLAPLGGSLWEGGGGTFINKGTNGRWKDSLPQEDSDKYEQTAEGFEFGIRSTPTMIINGRMIIGTLPFEQLRAIVIALIERAEGGGQFLESWEG